MSKLTDLDAVFDPTMNLLQEPAHTPGYHTRIADGTLAHDIRKSMDYALLCLEDGSADRVARAHAVIDAVLQLQVKDPLDKHFGIWGWFAEEPPAQMNPADFNWADFIGARIAQMLVLHASLLDATITARLRESLERAAMAIFRRQSPVSYTNIAIMGASVSAAAGEIVGHPVLLEYGRNKLQAVLELARRVGTFSEYNSPTYTMVAIDECERALRITRDARLQATARELLEVAWKMVEDHWHAPTQQWAGPHGRAYSDRIGQATRAKILAALGSRATAPIGAPRMVEMPLDGLIDGEAKTARTWLAPTCCISSVTREHTWTQRRQIIAYWNTPDAVAVFKVQFLLNGREMPGMRLATSHVDNRILISAYPLHGCGAWHPMFDIPDGSVFDAQDVRFRFQLEAPGAAVTELAEHSYRLAAGDHSVRIDALPGEFADEPIRWSRHEAGTVAAVDAVCLASPRRVSFETLRLRFAAAIQLLHPGASEATGTLRMSDEGPLRRVQWDATPDVQVPASAQMFSW